jgi:hypothetical protein
MLQLKTISKKYDDKYNILEDTVILFNYIISKEDYLYFMIKYKDTILISEDTELKKKEKTNIWKNSVSDSEDEDDSEDKYYKVKYLKYKNKYLNLRNNHKKRNLLNIKL